MAESRSCARWINRLSVASAGDFVARRAASRTRMSLWKPGRPMKVTTKSAHRRRNSTQVYAVSMSPTPFSRRFHALFHAFFHAFHDAFRRRYAALHAVLTPLARVFTTFSRKDSGKQRDWN